MTGSQHRIGTSDRPLRVAIFGSGPSGFYAAESLFRQKELAVSVDMFDRLPTPHGLVRYGVAPDHQKMKAVTRVYDKTASHERFRFFGNVELGRDITVDQARTMYDQIVYATGAETDRPLGIPGEDLEGSISSTAFVGWYNGHPDHRDLPVDLSCERVAVLGIGNVAIDVCRVLMRSVDELHKTDIADYALEALRESKVREVYLLGRRGPAQAAFSPKEIAELGAVAGMDLVVRSRDLPDDGPLVDTEDSAARKNVEYLRERLALGEGTHPRKVRLHLMSSPKQLVGNEGRVVGLEVEHNRLEPGRGGRLSAKGTGETETLHVGMAIRAIGYRGAPIPGVPFHESWGIIPNDDGRVLAAEGATELAPGQYAVGWAKRGPSGLIGTNRECSSATVQKMVEDLGSLPERPDGGLDAIVSHLRQADVTFVDYAAWRRLDAHERQEGEAAGRVRQKVIGTDAMMRILRGS